MDSRTNIKKHVQNMWLKPKQNRRSKVSFSEQNPQALSKNNKVNLEKRLRKSGPDDVPSIYLSTL